MTREELKASLERLRARRASIRVFDPSTIMHSVPKAGGRRLAAPTLTFAPEVEEEEVNQPEQVKGGESDG